MEKKGRVFIRREQPGQSQMTFEDLPVTTGALVSLEEAGDVIREVEAAAKTESDSMRESTTLSSRR